ncbi:MAG TPA: hypothetical protein VK358_00370 [Longimicrobium sp.]|nr:hypothetical protein [Longimicrobium sp.]
MQASCLLVLLACILHAAGAPCAAQPATPLQPGAHPPDTLREQYQERVPVSAPATLVGLMTDGPGRMLHHSRLRAFIPRGAGDSLCVTIRSQDGRYQGDFHYDMRRLGTGTVLLDVGTRRAGREVERYPLEQLAVLAYAAASCTRVQDRFIAAGWALVDQPRTLRVLLTADDLHRVRVVLVPGPDQPFTCPPLDARLERSFNRACSVALPPGPGEYQLRILGGFPGRPTPPVRVRLLVP